MRVLPRGLLHRPGRRVLGAALLAFCLIPPRPAAAVAKRVVRQFPANRWCPLNTGFPADAGNRIFANGDRDPFSFTPATSAATLHFSIDPQTSGNWAQRRLDSVVVVNARAVIANGQPKYTDCSCYAYTLASPTVGEHYLRTTALDFDEVLRTDPSAIVFADFFIKDPAGVSESNAAPVPDWGQGSVSGVRPSWTYRTIPSSPALTWDPATNGDAFPCASVVTDPPDAGCTAAADATLPAFWASDSAQPDAKGPDTRVRRVLFQDPQGGGFLKNTGTGAPTAVTWNTAGPWEITKACSPNNPQTFELADPGAACQTDDVTTLSGSTTSPALDLSAFSPAWASFESLWDVTADVTLTANSTNFALSPTGSSSSLGHYVCGNAFDSDNQPVRQIPVDVSSAATITFDLEDSAATADSAVGWRARDVTVWAGTTVPRNDGLYGDGNAAVDGSLGIGRPDGSQVSGGDQTPVDVRLSLTGLTPGTTYYVFASWTAGNGANYTDVNGAGLTLADVYAPVAETDAATGGTATGATLNGQVNPNNDTTDVHFEYGATTAYGQTTTPQRLVLDVDSVTLLTNDYRLHAVSAAISGLTCGTTYHYRVVATNAEGTTPGDDATVTPSCPSLSISDVSQDEGDSGTSTFGFVVTLSPAATTAVTVNYTTADGTAVAGSDYTATSGTLTFTPGQISKPLNVSVQGDTLYEADETFFVNLSGASVPIVDGQGQGTILNDDPLPSLSVGDVVVTEGNSGTVAAGFVVTLSKVSGATTTVSYATADGTATAGSDYTGASGTLTFAPGETSKTVNVAVSGDTLYEADETFFINLSGASVPIVDGHGQATILNDDPKPSLSINDVAVPEGDSGTTTAEFTVTQSVVSGAATTVNYATAPGTALAGSDYVATSGTLTIPAGSVAGVVDVSVKGDTDVEPDETFFVNLSGVNNATLSRSQGVGTITNDDVAASKIQFSAASYSVSEAGGQATITVTRSGDTSGTVTVAYSTTDGTATEPQDYQETSGHLTFKPHAKAASFKVPVVNRTAQEGSRTVLLFLSDPQPAGSDLGDQKTAVLTILDTDQGGKIQFSPASYSVDASAGPTTVLLNVKRTGGLATGVVVHFTMTDGTAVGGTDYDAAPGDLTFAGSGVDATLQKLEIPIFHDTTTAKTFTVTLGPPTGGAGLGAATKATVTILGAQPTLSFSASQYDVKTTTPVALITVKRSGPLAGAVEVTYSTQQGTATNGGVDYQDVHGTLTFGPKITTRTFGVPITKDPLPDVAKTVLLSLGAATWTLGTAAVDAALGSSTLTIEDPNQTPAVQFSAATYSVKESTSRATITVKRTGDLAGTLTVPYSATGGTAVNGFPANASDADYFLPPGVLNFDPGVSVRTFTVAIVNDDLDEGPETAELTLGAPTWSAGASTLGTPAIAVLTIDDDEPTIQFGAAAYSVSEAAKSVTVLVRRTGGVAAPASVTCQTTGGTAVPGSDYTPMPPTLLQFEVGQATKAVAITLDPDTVADGAKTIGVTLTGAAGAQLGTPSETVVTIKDNDVAGKAQFSAAGYSVAGSSGEATITVTRTGGTAGGATVHYSTADASAVGGTDYTPTSGTLTFGTNDKSETFVVQVTNAGVTDGSAVHLTLTLDTPGGGIGIGAPDTASLWIIRQ